MSKTLREAAEQAQAEPVAAPEATERVASVAAKLRAMATNYPAGHLWDKLDAKACIEGAMLLDGTHPKLAPQPAAQPVAVPEGYALVPVVPTLAMRKAGGKAVEEMRTYEVKVSGSICDSYATKRATPRMKAEAGWAAMLSAAPKVQP